MDILYFMAVIDNALEIIHDEKNYKFYCMVEKKECFVDYSIDENTIDFFHTYVPQSLRHQGIARKIYNHITAWLKNEESRGRKFSIKTSCSYAEKYFKENKQ